MTNAAPTGRTLPVTRRNLLAAAGAVSALGVVGCSTQGPGTEDPDTGTGGAATVAMPTWAEPAGLPEPDFPGVPGRLAAGYLSYPADPPAMAQEKPAGGGPISAAYPISGGAPPPVDRNVYWQAMNEALNCDFQATLVGSGEYTAKFSTMIAGNDLPDLIAAPSTYPQLPKLLEAQFTDLTEYVSGDAINDYPNLAYLATGAWQECTYNNKIFAIPQSKEPMPSVMFARKDIISETGLSAEVTSFAEFDELCRAIARPQQNRWAVGSVSGLVLFIMAMRGKPNQWIEEGGAFTHQIETEEYQQTLSEVATLWADDLIHPDALASDTIQQKNWLVSGACGLHWDGIGAWTDDVFKTNGLADNLTCIVPPGFDGGTGSSAISRPIFRRMLMRKAEPDRVRELLRFLDYLYAPFGSQEYLLKTYGVEGDNYALDGSEPIPTEQGITETALMMRYVGTPPVVTYTAGQPTVTEARYNYGASIQDIIVDDPTVGLYSDTEQSKATELTSIIDDGVGQIVQGGAGVDSITETIDRWRAQGGDQIRDELAQAWQAKG